MTDSWIDREAYPFHPNYLPVDGGQMHYVDEGQGRPIVMVHGTPTWSFLYRNQIKSLASDLRIVAPDHIGFGLSDKPANWPYRPQDHARNLEMLVNSLDLKDILLVVHDFGGPIGLSYALDHPDNVRGIVIANTFLWSLRNDPAFETPNRLFNNAFGRWLYLSHNFSARVIIRSAWGKKRPLTPAVHRQYIQALPDPVSRLGTWGFLQSLLGESEWYDSLWARRECITAKPALILWGMRDFAFKEKELKRWEGVFSNVRVVRYQQVGHFVPDEASEDVNEEIRRFAL